MSMDAEAILHELTHAAGLPTAALQAASAQRAELLPKFLGVIEDYLGRAERCCHARDGRVESSGQAGL
jgi:hypothetical protein